MSSYGYESCRDDREKDIAKGKSPSTCYTSSYTSTVLGCTYPYKQFVCRSELKLVVHTVSTLVYGRGVDESPMAVTTPGQSDKIVPCTFEKKWEEYEETTQ